MYIELHSRSAFSFLEGASLPEALIAVCADYGMPAMGPGSVGVMLQMMNGTLGASTNTPVDFGPTDLALADFNLDGFLDVVVTDAATVDNVMNPTKSWVSVLSGKGDGTWSGVQDHPTGLFPVAVLARDVNADGKPDVVVATEGGAGEIEVLINTSQ